VLRVFGVLGVFGVGLHCASRCVTAILKQNY